MGAIAGQERLFTLTNVDRPYRNFVEGMSDGAATVSTDGIVLYANQALATSSATTCQRIVGQPVDRLVAETSRARLAGVVGPKSPGGSIEAELLTTPDGHGPGLVGSSVLIVDGGHVTCLTVTDLTSERKAEAAMAHSAQHDALTGLPNRTLLTDRIEHALEPPRAPATGLMALLFCDVDGFKSVNDAYGHQIGDTVLKATAARGCPRPSDPRTPWPGSAATSSSCSASRWPTRRRRTLVAGCGPRRGRRAVTDVGEIEVTLSIGIAVASSGDSASSDTLLRDADEAMYKAKRQGPNVIEMFDDRLRDGRRLRLRLLTDLRRAESDGELRLVYQPVIDIATRPVVGTEALLRWENPSRGLVPPDEFIPFAERSGLIIGIGAWVMREACRQGGALAGCGARPPGQDDVGQRLRSSADPGAPGSSPRSRTALGESGLDPASLVLEVTESALMEDAAAALRVVHELKALGSAIAIDDFGTGYSSLTLPQAVPGRPAEGGPVLRLRSRRERG